MIYCKSISTFIVDKCNWFFTIQNIFFVCVKCIIKPAGDWSLSNKRFLFPLHASSPWCCLSWSFIRYRTFCFVFMWNIILLLRFHDILLYTEMQWSAVMMHSNITWFCIHHHNKCSKINRSWTRKNISDPNRWVLGCLLLLYPQLQRSWKGGILVSPCPFVRPSVCPSVDRTMSALYLQHY